MAFCTYPLRKAHATTGTCQGNFEENAKKIILYNTIYDGTLTCGQHGRVSREWWSGSRWAAGSRRGEHPAPPPRSTCSMYTVKGIREVDNVADPIRIISIRIKGKCMARLNPRMRRMSARLPGGRRGLCWDFSQILYNFSPRYMERNHLKYNFL